MAKQVPSVGRIVHYVSYGSPGGEFQSECRAAVVTAVHNPGQPDSVLSLCVLNPTGMYFNTGISHDEETKRGGTWHWCEYVPAVDEPEGT